MRAALTLARAAALLTPLAFTGPAHAQSPADAQAERAAADEPDANGICSRPMLGPAEIAVRDTGLDEARGGCGRSTLRVQTRAAALIDTPVFYGTLAASVLAAVRHKENEYFEWELGARAFDYRFAQNASVIVTEAAYGPIYVGGTGLFSGHIGDRAVALASGLRLSIPYSDAGYDVATLTIAPAVAATLEVSPRLHLHSRGALLLWLAAATDSTRGRTAVTLSTDAAHALTCWLALTAGTEVQSGWYELGLDHWLMRGAIRTRLSHRYRLDVSAAVPLAGAERTDFLVQLAVTRDL